MTWKLYSYWCSPLINCKQIIIFYVWHKLLSHIILRVSNFLIKNLVFFKTLGKCFLYLFLFFSVWIKSKTIQISGSSRWSAILLLLTHFMSLVYFYTPGKHQKISVFGGYRKRPVAHEMDYLILSEMLSLKAKKKPRRKAFFMFFVISEPVQSQRKRRRTSMKVLLAPFFADFGYFFADWY